MEAGFRSKYLEIKSEKYVLLSSLIYLWCVFELCFTGIFKEGWINVEKKSALLFIPIIILSKKELFHSLKDYFFKYLSYALSLALIICFLLACIQYSKDQNPEHFIFQSFSDNLNISAIYLSLLCMLCVGYLQLNIQGPLFSNRTLQYLLIFILSCGILLLASKMHIVIYGFLSIAIIFKNAKAKKALFYVFILSLILFISAIIFTDNPIKNRFNDIKIERIELLEKDKFSPDIYLDGLSLRLLWIRFGIEILNEQKAWIKGVSPGNSKSFLDQKIKDYNFYTGIKGTHDTGYLKFNYHNQYIETLVDSGIIGLILLILLMIYLVYYSHINKNWILLYGLIIFGVCFLSESILERQLGVISFSMYFALLLCNRKKSTQN